MPKVTWLATARLNPEDRYGIVEVQATTSVEAREIIISLGYQICQGYPVKRSVRLGERKPKRRRKI